MEKKSNKLIIALIVLVMVSMAFVAGREFYRFESSRKDLGYSSVSVTAYGPESEEPEPESEAEPEPEYTWIPISGEYYALTECTSRADMSEEAESVNAYAKCDLLPIKAIEAATGYYMLEDGSILLPTDVNEGRVQKLDMVMYVAKECNVRSGPGTEHDKVGRYEELGTEVHVTGVDIFTDWWQIDGEKYVGSGNLIESRTTEMDAKMYVVKKCNVRTGPSTDYELKTEYYSGKEVHVVGQDVFTGFYKLENGNYVGSSNLAKKIPTLYTAKDNPKKIKYEWTSWYKKKSMKWSITIDKSLYEYYKGVKRKNGFANMSEYYSEEANEYYVKMIADAFTKMGKDQGLTKDQIAQEALYFISIIDYKTDKKSRKVEDWSKYVIETLYDDAGDCEDTSILTAGVFLKLGYKVALIALPEHCAVGISGGNFSGTYYELDGEKYFYVETTGEGWKIGQIPDKYKKDKATLYRLN